MRSISLQPIDRPTVSWSMLHALHQHLNLKCDDRGQLKKQFPSSWQTFKEMSSTSTQRFALWHLRSPSKNDTTLRGDMRRLLVKVGN